METTCLIQEPQMTQKLNEEEDIDGNSKCLGDLPEEILRHILSFLPTIDAVRTSVLSKRWEYLWDSIPNLDFQQSWPPKRRNLLLNFVERVFCLRGSYDINRFTLYFDVPSDASRVNTWISDAVRHNVQKLKLELHNFAIIKFGEFSLPCSLFTCKTLTSFHLHMRNILKLRTTICFSNLKTLTIGSVTFSDECLTNQFFSSLPVLEDLCLNDCSWGDVKVVRLSAPKLQYLSILECETRSYGDGCQIMIFGDNLIDFCYSGRLFSNYCLYKSSSLERAELDSFPDKTSEQIFAHRMYNLLIGLSNVKLLRLSSKVVKVFTDASEHLPQMPMFNNLTDLKFLSSVDLDCIALWRILQNCPCLKTLKFRGISLSLKWENDDWILDPLPSCFLSHLKWIKVRGYVGDEKQLSAVKILLKNAVVLDEIIIFCSRHYEENLEKQENLYKQLIEIPKGSQNCKIVLKSAFLEPLF